ncbi:DUF2479 domain-containing protein [Ruminococcus sp. AF42-10]|nr:BppU family phage baseplate upper protein [Ruminococcus sp. AF42-10]RGF40169.1 DUF2479 domain-containing protein [Ruminococcus sp. AF42-10]
MKTYNKIYTVHAWKDNNKFFTVTQGEGGIKYPRLMVVDDKGAIDLTGSAVTYTITLPRGSEEIVDATIIDAKRGVVEFEVKPSMTAYAGVGEGEINITIDNKVLKIGGINLTINKSTSGRVIEASEQFSALLTLISKYSNINPENKDLKILENSDITDTAKNYPSIKYLLNNFWSNNNLSLLSAIVYGVSNSGAMTSLSKIPTALLSKRCLYFPAGTYKCNGIALSNIDDLTIICDNANFVFYNQATNLTDAAETTVQSSFFKFTNCNNLTIIGGCFDGQHKVSQCITLIGCQNSNISNANIKGAGNKASSFAAGINLIRNCSQFNINNVIVSDIKAGTVSEDTFIHAVGIGVSNVNGEFSQHGYISNSQISNINGYKVGNKEPDGDGIYLIQRPSADCTGDSYITVSNCTITDCAKRGIKVSTRHTNIDNCYIDIDGWGAAIEAQYGKMTLRDSTIHNKYASCVTLDWDNGTNYIDNCKLYGADKTETSTHGDKYIGNGIVLNQRLSVTGTYYTNEPCSVIARNCTIENVTSPLRSGYAAGLTYQYQSVIFDDCQIGHYRGASAIMFDASMISAINKLSLSDVNYKYGITENEVQTANNQYFGLTNSGNTLDIGSTTYVKPNHMIYTNNLTDDYNKMFRMYDLLDSDFGAPKANVSDVLEDAPNILSCTNGTYTSKTNTHFSVVATDNTLSIKCDTAYTSGQSFVYVKLDSLELKGGTYNFYIDNITPVSSDVTITFADSSYNIIDTSLELALNKTSKSLIVDGVTKPITYLRVKLAANKTIDMQCTVSLANRNKVLKGNLEARVAALEKIIQTKE